MAIGTESELRGTERVVPTVCSSHCGGACLLKVHVKGGVITRIETDDGAEPQLRGCLRGRAYRQRVYDPERVLYPMKRVGDRGEGKFERVSWDEALDTVAGELKRVRDTYGPASIVVAPMPGDHSTFNHGCVERLISMAGGCTTVGGITSFQAGIVASLATYGMWFTDNMRDDMVNSRLIILWGWNPADTISGTNSCWYMAQAREAGARIVSVDPRYTDTAAALADQWIPIRPGTDAAMLIAMAHVMIREGLHDRKFLDTYTIGFDRFKEYVLGVEDGVPKTPGWAENITGVPSATIERLAREYAGYGEQFHRAASTLAAMTGNIGIHGGDAAGRSWESIVVGGFPYPEMLMPGLPPAPNPVEADFPTRGWGPAYDAVLGQKPRVHWVKLADAIIKGKAGGYHADYKLLYVAHCNYLNQFPNSNKIRKALESLEFIVVEEQLMTPTARYADIILPVCTFMERNSNTVGHGSAFVGRHNQVISPLGESKSILQISVELAERLGVVGFVDKTEEQLLQEQAARFGVPDYAKFKAEGIYKYPLPEPYVAFKAQIEDPTKNPFYTPSGKIEIYSQQWARENNPNLPPVAKYIETWESRNDPVAKRYPLQLITTHFKRRTLSQFENLPWLRELQRQAILMNPEDARARKLKDGETVRVFNDRGEVVIPVRVTERIMPGVIDMPHGAWYRPDERGVDRGGCANVLTSDQYSPSGAFPYNTALVEVEKI
ncbi:MAG: molybdopterin-dependent oxidoreductase [Chloroflexi bacterium]|nr:molybdopterin-dependent oxidoreductase [Chloroflexota bacterium]